MGDGDILQIKTRRALRRRSAGALAPIILLGLWPALAVLSAPVAAQTPPDFAGNLGPLYQGILARPSDLSATLQYAASASADAKRRP